MTRLLRRLFAIVAFVGVFAWLLTNAVDQELASGGVLTERGVNRGEFFELRRAASRSVSACGASSCGERLSERGVLVGPSDSSHGEPRTTVAPFAPRSESLYPTVVGSRVGTYNVPARTLQPGTYQGRSAKWWARRAVQNRKNSNARGLTIKRMKREVALLERLNLDPLLAIRVVFGPWSAQAIRVSSCETGRTFDVNARNGQYLGLFQMGSYARSAYGHSSSALGQARAAFSYFVASGRDWSPWECKP